MIRTFLLLLSTCLIHTISAQTEALEKAHLNQLIQEGGNSQATYKKWAQEWRKMIQNFGGYPALPYNEQTKQIEFKFSTSLSGIPKQVIIDRIEEWISINYGSIDQVLHYKNQRTGKLIVKGYFALIDEIVLNNFWGFQLSNKVTEGRCRHTAIFTITDGKLKVEYTNLKYEVSYDGRYDSTFNTYIPSGTITTGLHQLYPVTAGDIKSWQPKLTALKLTDIECTATFQNLVNYIKEHKTDYQF